MAESESQLQHEAWTQPDAMTEAINLYCAMREGGTLEQFDNILVQAEQVWDLERSLGVARG